MAAKRPARSARRTTVNSGCDRNVDKLSVIATISSQDRVPGGVADLTYCHPVQSKLHTFFTSRLASAMIRRCLTTISSVVLCATFESPSRTDADSYAYEFRPDPELLATLGRLIALEHECSRFLTFKISLEAGKAAAVIREVTSSPGAKPVRRFPGRSSIELRRKIARVKPLTNRAMFRMGSTKSLWTFSDFFRHSRGKHTFRNSIHLSQSQIAIFWRKRPRRSEARWI